MNSPSPSNGTKHLDLAQVAQLLAGVALENPGSCNAHNVSLVDVSHPGEFSLDLLAHKLPAGLDLLISESSFKSDDPQIREAALAVVAQYGILAERYSGSVVQLLKGDKEARVRRQAVVAAFALVDKVGVDPILAATNDFDKGVQSCAFECLVKCPGIKAYFAEHKSVGAETLYNFKRRYLNNGDMPFSDYNPRFIEDVSKVLPVLALIDSTGSNYLLERICSKSKETQDQYIAALALTESRFDESRKRGMVHLFGLVTSYGYSFDKEDLEQAQLTLARGANADLRGLTRICALPNQLKILPPLSVIGPIFTLLGPDGCERIAELLNDRDPKVRAGAVRAITSVAPTMRMNFDVIAPVAKIWPTEQTPIVQAAIVECLGAMQQNDRSFSLYSALASKRKFSQDTLEQITRNLIDYGELGCQVIEDALELRGNGDARIILGVLGEERKARTFDLNRAFVSKLLEVAQGAGDTLLQVNLIKVAIKFNTTELVPWIARLAKSDSGANFRTRDIACHALVEIGDATTQEEVGRNILSSGDRSLCVEARKLIYESCDPRTEVGLRKAFAIVKNEPGLNLVSTFRDCIVRDLDIPADLVIKAMEWGESEELFNGLCRNIERRRNTKFDLSDQQIQTLKLLEDRLKEEQRDLQANRLNHCIRVMEGKVLG